MNTHHAYQELGLSPSASDAELKTAWRRLVAAWHPDRNPAANALQRMQAINKAYQHIRQLRDETGSQPEADDSSPASASTQAHATQAEQAQTSDPTHAEPDGMPAPHVRTVTLSLEETILGCTRSLRGHFTLVCTTCVGTGLRVLAQCCRTCKGSGAIRRSTLFGWLWNDQACPDCSGDGRLRVPCDTCDSRGEVNVAYHRRVRFAPGMRTGDVLNVPPARGGTTDIRLELRVEVEPHSFFKIDEQGVLRCEMPVNGYAWMTGRWVEVPTPDGLQQMRLNRDALVYRLGGKGLPNGLRGPRGDFIVKVMPVFAPINDPAQEKLLDQFIASTNQAAESADGDEAQPLGDWKRTLKQWQAGQT